MRLRDEVGNRYGRLLVVKRSDKSQQSGNVFWVCNCDCGNEIIVNGSTLRKGKINKCDDCSVNTFEVKEDYVIGFTTNGDSFLFDLDMLDIVNKYSWHINTGYVVSANKIKLHRLIMNSPTNLYIDHINHNTTDNRKINLRICTNQQNQWNSLHKGYTKRGPNRYEVQIQGKYYCTCKTKKEAIETRQRLEKELYGEFAYSIGGVQQ